MNTANRSSSKLKRKSCGPRWRHNEWHNTCSRFTDFEDRLNNGVDQQIISFRQLDSWLGKVLTQSTNYSGPLTFLREINLVNNLRGSCLTVFWVACVKELNDRQIVFAFKGAAVTSPSPQPQAHIARASTATCYHNNHSSSAHETTKYYVAKKRHISPMHGFRLGIY